MKNFAIRNELKWLFCNNMLINSQKSAESITPSPCIVVTIVCKSLASYKKHLVQEILN